VTPRLDERLGIGGAFALQQQRNRLRPIAIDLGDIEDRECPGENPVERTVLVDAVIAGRVRLLPQYDGRAHSPLRTWAWRAFHCR
jgi:hypothetical protein